MATITQHQDNLRSGFNPNETTLTTINVKDATFGKKSELLLDGSVYAQPLVATDVVLPGQTQAVDILFVATMHSSLYAFDITTSGNNSQLWRLKLGSSIQLPNDAVGPGGYRDIAWEVGILSTPVIDTTAGVIYAVSTRQDAANNITHILWKIGLNGIIVAQTPPLTASFGTKVFASNRQIQRCALALASNTVYLAFAAYGDRSPWQGWVLGYDADTLAQKYTFCTEPNAGIDGAGFWQAGQGPAVDEDGNLYLMTGNSYPNGNGTNPTSNEYGCSVVKLSPTLAVLDYFAPMDAVAMSIADDDLGSGGVLLIPGTDLALGGGKTHELYLMDRANLGKYSTTKDNVLQKFNVVESSDLRDITHHIHGSPVYYRSPTATNLYIWPENMEMKQMSLTVPGGAMSLTITARTAVRDPDNFPGGTAGMPGGFMTISSNGNPAAPNSGVLWCNHPYQGDANQAIRGGVLRAFDPENVGNQLWDSRDNYVRDDLGNFAKFCCPTVAKGHVYQATMGGLQQRTTIDKQTRGTPALANQADKALMLAWANPANGALNTAISLDGLTWNPDLQSTIPDIVSQFQPSLAHDPSTGTSYLAWTDTTFPGNSGRLTISSSTTPLLTSWTAPIPRDEFTFTGPSIAAGAGYLFVAWTGTDAAKSINLASSLDGGQTWHKKLTLPDTSASRPSLAFQASPTSNTLILAWNGQGNGRLNFWTYNDLDGFSDGRKVTMGTNFDVTTNHGFAVDFEPATGNPAVAWTRGDDRGSLSTATSDTEDVGQLAEPGMRYRWLNDDFQASGDGPSLAGFQGRVAVAWENAGVVNVGVLSRGSVVVYGLLPGGENEQPGPVNGTTTNGAHYDEVQVNGGTETVEANGAAVTVQPLPGSVGEATVNGGVKKSRRKQLRKVLLCGLAS
ncbi:hypothetical protein B0H63DRAFT_464722 [Podospora didyma]|uniref:Uncharacterized protein n=1 Tax=Podospora didyma TaxID=330526 RepID=A0AAE0NYD2_9PEZI|nr:hypothetical protein B0H63DRAFT_464722 [Podospora didyma]